MAKKIMFVCTQMEAGGVQIRATSMAQALRHLGYDAKTVFLYKKRGIFPEDENTICLTSGGKSKLSTLISSVIALNRLVKREKVDAVIGMAHYSSPIACAVGWINGVRSRIATQTNPPESHSLLARLLDVVCGSLGIYTENIVNSKQIESKFVGWPAVYRKKLSLIYNGIKVRQPTMTRQEAREFFGLPADAIIIGNCGRLSKQKNQRFILELSKSISSHHIAILGDGELKGELAATIKEFGLEDRVHLLGETAPENVPNFLQCLDLFLFPSLYEAFGLAVVEAMAMGVPVITSDDPALLEVIGPGGASLPLVEELWLKEISAILDDRSIWLERSKRAAERAEEYSFEKMLDGFVEKIGKRG